MEILYETTIINIFMTPEEYEHYVAQSFKEMGYETLVTSFSNDYGGDVFAVKGEEKIAIQVKKYREAL